MGASLAGSAPRPSAGLYGTRLVSVRRFAPFGAAESVLFTKYGQGRLLSSTLYAARKSAVFAKI
jgi:hypothetical protein